MTKNSKKIIGWLLGVVAFVALAFGIAFTRPQVKAVGASTIEVSWADTGINVQNMGDYKRFLIQTSGEHWTSYNNESYADNYLAYTKLNG